jgi:hypothetical protein
MKRISNAVNGRHFYKNGDAMNNDTIGAKDQVDDAVVRQPNIVMAAAEEMDGRPPKRHRGAGESYGATRSPRTKANSMTTGTTTTTLLGLPLAAMVDISHCLSIVDCRRLAMTCRTLWSTRRGVEVARTRAVATSAAERQLLRQLRPLPKLETLDVGGGLTVDDNFLVLFDWRIDFPSLRELSMEGAASVTGEAVVRALRLHPSLRYVNVMWCPLVEYVDALRLRDCLVQPNAVIRRLPKEFCGMKQLSWHEEDFGVVGPYSADPIIFSRLTVFRFCNLSIPLFFRTQHGIRPQKETH